MVEVWWVVTKTNKPIDGVFTSLELTDLECGYLAFGDGLPGDHRMAWLDIPYSLAFGYNPPHLHQPERRVLNLEDPRVEDFYHKEVLERFSHHKIFDKVDRLTKLVQQHASVDRIQRMHHQIAKLNQSIRLAVERRMKACKRGGVPWSP